MKLFQLRDNFLIFFTLMAAISGFIAPYKLASINQLNVYITLLLLYIFWSFSLLKLDKDTIRKLVIHATTVVVFVQVFICFLQVIKGSELGLNFLGEGIVDARLGTTFPTVTGTFGHPGPLSLFFMISLCMYFPYVIMGRNMVALLGFIVGTVGLLITFSRTSISIATIILLLEWIYIQMKFHRHTSKTRTIIVILFIVILLTQFGSTIVSRFDSLSSFSDSQVEHRSIHIKLAWEYIKLNPFIGYGLNNWAYVMKTQVASGIVDSFYYKNPVHNMYLLIWFEGGILFLVFFLATLLSSLYVAISRSSINGFTIGLCGGVICLLLYGLVGWGLFAGSQMLLVFYLILALLKRESRSQL